MIDAHTQKSQELHAEGIRKVEKTRYRKLQNLAKTIAADHKVLDEENESRLHHRHVAVVQGLATQWIKSFPRRN